MACATTPDQVSAGSAHFELWDRRIANIAAWRMVGMPPIRVFAGRRVLPSKTTARRVGAKSGLSIGVLMSCPPAWAKSHSGYAPQDFSKNRGPLTLPSPVAGVPTHSADEAMACAVSH